MKRFIKKIIFYSFPELGHYISAINNRRKFNRENNGFQLKMASKLYPDQSFKILTGPFQGINYINEPIWGSITPKWMGSYEQELHPIIDDIVRKQYDTVIDIGSAEGYYAVGLAKMLPASKVFSFDIDPIARKQQRRLSKLNSISNINFRKFCTYAEIQGLVCKKTIIICDIEGFELQLLNPVKAPKLTESDILVEIHSFEKFSMDHVGDELIKRFTATHDINIIKQASRDTNYYAQVLSHRLNEREILSCINEFRTDPTQYWLWMTCK